VPAGALALDQYRIADSIVRRFSRLGGFDDTTLIAQPEKAQRVKRFQVGKSATLRGIAKVNQLCRLIAAFAWNFMNEQRQLQLLEDELRRARRMAALGELASTTTHEFNNILTTIINYAKLGLRHKDEPSRDKALNKILAAATRAEKITNGVLGIARARGHERAPTDLARLIEGSLVLLEREMQKYRVQIELQAEPAPPAMVCAGEIQQVLLNLLTNARQAMPRGGRIIIRVAPDASTGTVDLTVRDTGSGIAPEILPRIFDRYFSTKQGPDATGKGGTGVGLSACREIIEAHQGKIRVESTVGVGTAFTLKLPAAKVASARTPVPISKLGIPSGNAAVSDDGASTSI
jgi:signal transduction histidine kinase